MTRITALLVLVSAILALAAPASAVRVAGKIVVTVGPGPKLVLETKAGARFKTLKPGFYLIFVRDLSNRRNFHLLGPGVNRASSVKGVKGGAIWRLWLRKGTYQYYSDGFRSTMNGSFKVV
ncbi:MAG: hypothetical protein H0U03_05930 [Actinobacteria bacterium]|nr:hypothetical protein [Actinomycetota bacterium]